jgi:hypothetical protein
VPETKHAHSLGKRQPVNVQPAKTGQCFQFLDGAPAKLRPWLPLFPFRAVHLDNREGIDATGAALIFAHGLDAIQAKQLGEKVDSVTLRPASEAVKPVTEKIKARFSASVMPSCFSAMMCSISKVKNEAA